jgi:hypothetical protein
MAEAIKRANSTDGAKIRDALNGIKNYPGVVGKTTFGTSLAGFPIRPVTVQLWSVKPGTNKVVRKLVAKISLRPQDIPK